MKDTILYFKLSFVYLFLCAFDIQAQEKLTPVDYVNPLMGTLSTFEISAGNVYPAISRPWGMNSWTPQTGEMGSGWIYVYTQNKIKGFKQTHQPSPWINDYGQFAIMPVTGKPNFDENDRASWFSHKTEEVMPYYYKVYLADYDIVTEITPTDRAAVFRFTFPETDSSFVVIDALDKGSYIKVIPGENKIIGYTTKNAGGVPDNFRNYFVIVFDKPFASVQTFADGQLTSGTEQEKNHVGGIVGFSTFRGETVQARVASSFISFDQAEINLREVQEYTFDEIKKQSRQVWNDLLGRIDVEGGSDTEYRTFYSCLYRSMLFPRKFYEKDARGNIVHYSPYNGLILPGYMYTDTGFWDTFRALFPMLNLLFPSVNEEIQKGLVNTYKESGFYPEWASPGHRGCMIGNNSASVLTDAYMTGVRTGEDMLLYEGLLKGANNVHPEISSVGRLGWQYYNKLGYVPYNVGINENAARTLEYAYDDWCIYQMAKQLNRPQEEIDLYADRCQNYKNVFDKSTLLMRGRNEDGAFQSPFNPLKWGDAFTEGNSWHYTWSVFHDVQGLIDLMGGEKTFVHMLDSIFIIPPVFDESYYGIVIHEIREMQIMNMGNYAHGNQPIQHVLYLYNYAGEPWKSQYWLREVLKKMYLPSPDGYCGDEDNGQTSAFYVFSALGFYPVCPGSKEYVLGTPLFKKFTITLENGKNIILEAPENSHKNRYIDRLLLNGKNVTRNYLTYDELKSGATLKFKMSEKPNYKRGTARQDRPYSFSLEK
ncbi:MAG: GH92 family glycosyl hydrolase [Bacteroidales bacterium]|nr:GH92 family glycosyl hydrolase [Bacteroidales bacterium]